MNKENKSSSNYLDILNQKKEGCYLFMRLMNVIPLIKLKIYSPLSIIHNDKYNYIYLSFENMCKRDIYIRNIYLHYVLNEKWLNMYIKKKRKKKIYEKYRRCTYF